MILAFRGGESLRVDGADILRAWSGTIPEGSNRT
jgi:hypothetical protein